MVAGVFIFVIMAKQRIISTKFWDDTYIINLDPTEKLLFLYFLTNPLTNISGIYEISLRRIAFDTGIDSEMILNILKRFEKDKKAIYKNNWLCILNFIKNQNINPSVLDGIKRELKEVPKDILRQAVTTCDILRQDGTLNLTKLNLTKQNKTSFLKKNKKPFFKGNEMRKSRGKWFVIIDSEWKEFAGREDQIEWK